MKKYLLPLILILCLALTISGYSADLYGTYGQRTKLTVDHTKIDSDVTWFPVTVKLTGAQGEEVFTEFDADEDFDRIAFTTSDGETQLYADCEIFDDTNQLAIYHVSKTGWVLDNDVDTDFYLYYSNTADHNTTYISKSGNTAAQSVWDSNFKAVYHMDDPISIDVGYGTVDMASSREGNRTIIDLTNPANATGTLTKVQIWAASGYNLVSAKVATFYNVAGSNYTARDSVSIGTVTSGSIQTFIVDLDVVAGDFIGIYFTTGQIESTTSGSSGIYYLAGDQTACENAEFAVLDADGTIALYGTTINTIIDSTSNGNHGAKKGTGEPVEAVGKAGQGQNFDKTDDYIGGGGILEATDDFTVEAIFIADQELSDANTLVSKRRTVATTNGWEFRISSDTAILGYITYSTNAINTGNVTVDSLGTSAHYAAMQVISKVCQLYLDGGSVGNTDSAEGDVVTSDANFSVGAKNNVTAFMDGTIDEVRISYTGRPAAWLKATYNSLYDTLLTYGDEETEALGGIHIFFTLSDF